MTEKNQTIKIGLDLHGVMSDLPTTFKFLGESILKNSGEVHIITGTVRSKAQEELKSLGFVKGRHYSTLFCIVDHMVSSGAKSRGIHPVFKNPEFDDDAWDKVKGDYCRANNISLHIDDSLAYAEHFTTPFARLWTKTDTPKINKPKRHQP